MLPKKFRLPIQEVFNKRGKAIKTPFFLIKIFPSRLSYSRFGIIISKKAVAGSAARNRLKRIIFSVCNPKENTGNDFLIIASPKIKELEKGEIIKNLKYVSSHLL